MPIGPAVPVMGIHLVREGDHAVVYVYYPDGSKHQVISEHCEGQFSHHITEWGLAGIRDGDKGVVA